MDIKKVSVSEMFSMLLASFRLVDKHPGRFALASILSVLIGIVLAVLFFVAFVLTVGLSQLATYAQSMQNSSTEYPIFFYATMIPLYLISIPLIAGWLKLCQNSDKNQPSTAHDIFLYFHFNDLFKKLIYYSVISIVIYLSISYLYEMLFLAVGVGVDYKEYQAAINTNAGGNPSAILDLGVGFWIATIGLVIIGLLMQAMIFIGFIHAALTNNSVIDSVKAGIVGVLKNLIAIVVFSIIILIAMLVVLAIAMLSVYLLSLLHIALAVIAGIALTVGAILFIYPLEFSFLYYFWNGILGNEIENPTPEFNNPEVLI